MKVSQESTFKPVVITLETQDEVDVMASLFNYSPLVEANPLFHILYSELKHLGSTQKYFKEIEKALSD